MSLVTRAARHALHFARARAYDRVQNAEARKAYGQIVAAEPERALSFEQKREIRAYARQHFGSALYSPWLETYAAWRGEFVKGCLPDNYVGRFVVPYTRGQYPGALRNTVAKRMLASDRFADVGYVFRGALFDADHAPAEPGRFRSRIFDQHPFLYLKQASGLQGKGVRRVTAETFADAIAGEDEAVLQYPIEVHPALAEFAPGAGTTLRVTTVYDQGPPRVIAAHVRFPRPGDTHVGASRNVSATADFETGELLPIGKRDGWTPTETHPVTGKAFAGFVVPSYAEACAVALDHHARVPHFRYIGWDIAVTRTGEIMFFEANVGHADVKTAEAYYGPIFDGLGWDRLHRR